MKKSLLFSFQLLALVGFATAIPVLALGFLGRYIDNILKTGQVFFVVGLVIAAPLSYLLVKKIVTRKVKSLQS